MTNMNSGPIETCYKKQSRETLRTVKRAKDDIFNEKTVLNCNVRFWGGQINRKNESLKELRSEKLRLKLKVVRSRRFW